MYHPARGPAAFDYNPQATVDHEEADELYDGIQPAEKRRVRRGNRANYKPMALTWPFIATQILVLLLALGLVIWAEKAMPDSDSTAILDPVPTLPGSARMVRRGSDGDRVKRRQGTDTTGAGDTTAVEEVSTTAVDLTSDTLVPTPTVTVVVVDEVTTSSSVVIGSSSDTPSDAVTSEDRATFVIPATSLTDTTQGNPVASDASETPTDLSVTTIVPIPSDSDTSNPVDTTSDGSASPVTSPESSISSDRGSSTEDSSTEGSSSSSDRPSPTESQTTSTGISSKSTGSTGSAGPTGFSQTTSLTSDASDSLITGSSWTTSSASGSSSPSSSGSSSDGSSSSTDTSSASSSSSNQSKDKGLITLTDSTATNMVISKSTSIFTSNYTTTRFLTSGNFTTTVTMPETTSTFNTTMTFVSTTNRTITVGVSTVPSSTSYYSSSPPEPPTLGKTHVPTSSEGYKATSSDGDGGAVTVPPPPQSFTVVPGTTLSSVVVEHSTVTSSTVFETTTEIPATTSTIVETYVPYLETGETVITSVQTIVIQPAPTPEEQENTPAPPVIVTGTKVEGGQVQTIVETFAPETKVFTGGVYSQIYTPPPQTIVSQVGGRLTTNYVVVTPTYTVETAALRVQSTVGGVSSTVVQTQAPQTMVTSQDGRLVTIVTTPPPQTQVTVIGGTLTTVPVFTTSSGFQPITYKVTTNLGGSTSVVVETFAPTKVVATINGTPVTIDTTMPPRTYITTFGGTLVTQTTVTTPTNSDPITLTFASTVGGTLTTIVQTFAPSTIVTRISGTLTTIVSTPSPSTRVSTGSARTTTYTSTSTPPSTLAESQTTSAQPAQTSLIITTKEYDLTSRTYFVATFVPPILAVSLTIPLRIIDLNAKLYQPFTTLAHGPSPGHGALTLQFTGLMGFLTPVTTLFQGHPVPFITTLAVLCSSLLVPLAVEAISLKLHGRCSQISTRGCAAAMGVSPAANHALMAVAAVVVLLLCLLLFFLRGWTTGLNANPWNMAGIASLARNGDVRIRRRDDDGIRREVGERMYGLGFFEAADGREEYGLYLADESGRGLSGVEESDGEGEAVGVMMTGAGDVDSTGGKSSWMWRRAKKLPFMTLRHPWRVGFMLWLAGLLAFIAYYDFTLVRQTGGLETGMYTQFHLFFDSHNFGVRFLFASIGVIITFCWQAFFVAVATIIPYHSLATTSQPPQTSVLLSRPSNAFHGLFQAVKLRHAFYFLTSLSAILSEFLPILLSNIPHKLTQVLLPTLVCTRISLAMLATMLLVVAASFFIRWPPMPVDPRSVAGALWYVCHSRRMLDGFAGLAEMAGPDRDRRVVEMGRRYYFGELVGVSRGTTERIGVDVVAGFGEAIETGYFGRRGQDSVYSDRGPDQDLDADLEPYDDTPLVARREEAAGGDKRGGYQSVQQLGGLDMLPRRDDLAPGGMEPAQSLSFKERMQVRSQQRFL